MSDISELRAENRRLRALYESAEKEVEELSDDNARLQRAVDDLREILREDLHEIMREELGKLLKERRYFASKEH